ncbi:MarR family transcriptional regulator [Hyphomicrobium sp. CS1GBMeth3]|uniref:MarR family transcriptional regulator n=1 Tax=Hyphomicrobium sp. CS1GBMeth3 TaxID=1892845 RepID=UPI000931F527|nr:MarR family transcriptional regulator [Hyphomicrobium sp. CS1GBMeth3]
MLFRNAVLEKIKTGDVTLAFRRWRRPTVKAGGMLRTPVGVLAIVAVEVCSAQEVSEREARAAGFASRADALTDIAKQRDGQLYRIRFHLAGADPRHALRARSAPSQAELDDVLRALDRLDTAAGAVPWTRRLLNLISDRDGVLAGDLAAEIGVEKDVLKRRVRKLKELGLTESLTRGYRLSPRGATVLARLK